VAVLCEARARCGNGVHHSNEEVIMSERRPTAAVLEANKAFKPAAATRNDYEKEQNALDQNRERLKAERLAREAAVGDGKQPKKLA
jgi:hypothetical protein